MDEAVQDFANELDKRCLQIGSPLGGGEFAEVFIGTLKKEKKTVNVAIKTLRVRNSAANTCSKSEITMTTEQRHRSRCDFFIVNFEQISHRVSHTYQATPVTLI